MEGCQRWGAGSGLLLLPSEHAGRAVDGRDFEERGEARKRGKGRMLASGPDRDRRHANSHRYTAARHTGEDLKR